MKKKFWSVMLVVALLGVAGCLGFIAWHIFSDMGAQQVYEETVDLVTHPRDESTPADESEEEDVGESGLTVADIEYDPYTKSYVLRGETKNLPFPGGQIY